MNEPIVRTIDVPCGQEQAFNVFLEMNSWWPKDRFATSVMRGSWILEIRVERNAGGRIIEVAADGREQLWGTIREYHPYGHIRMDFHVPHPSEVEPGFTRVDVRFSPISATSTRVELTQSGWEGLGDSAEMAQSGYGQAWGMIFELAYRQACG